MKSGNEAPIASVDTGQESALWPGGWPQTGEDFGWFIDTFEDRIVRYAFRRLGDLHLAQDAAQEVFVRTYQARERLAGVKNVSAFLYKTASNLCTDYARRHKRGPREMGDAGLDAAQAKGPTGPEAAAAWEEIQRIERILSRIPGDQAEIIRMRVFDEMTFSDIAEMIGCPTATVKSRFRYGIEKVREIIGKGKEA